MPGDEARAALVHAVGNWNRGDLKAYMELYAEKVVLHRVPHDLTGKGEVRTSYEGMWRTFPNSRLALDDVIAEGDKVACRYTWEAKRDDRQIVSHGMTILHFSGGQCVERWDMEAGH